jgi:catechol 2,3-dioxygenase-like lactoylglutathione lyase family enzyme
MDTISPNIFVADIKQTISFYQQLGFNVVTTVPEQGDIF